MKLGESLSAILYQSAKKTPLSGQYTSLSTEESSKTTLADLNTDPSLLIDENSPPHNRELRYVRNAIIVVLIISSGILGFGLIRSQASTNGPTTVIHHCGITNTTAEARAMGCVFDILGNSWTPQQCFDKETADEFREYLQRPERQMGEFPFFHDKDGEVRIKDENELAESIGSLVYTTQEHHLAHCTFMMRRIFRVGQSNGHMILNSRYGTLGHTVHCTNEVLLSFRRPDPKHMGGVHAGFRITFEHC